MPYLSTVTNIYVVLLAQRKAIDGGEPWEPSGFWCFVGRSQTSPTFFSFCPSPRKGQAYTRKWMDEQCKLLTVDDTSHAVRDVVQFLGDLKPEGGDVRLG